MLTGCYIVAALVLVAACNDGLDIQTKYPFTVETMPVPKKLKVNETAGVGKMRITRSAGFSMTEKARSNWMTARCCCPMSVTRWKKNCSGCISPRCRTSRAA